MLGMTMDVTRTSPAPVAGFIGGGFMADVHSRASRSARASLRGITSSSPASSERAASRLGLSVSYPSSAQLLADDTVDVVHVCTPNATHFEFALAAIDAGKHVVCEKPLATSSADAEKLASRARAAGVTATVPFVYRYHPMVREARARVARGELGTLLTIQGGYLQDWLLSKADDDWRVDASLGGPSRAFADIGSHLCDLIEFVTGDRITRLAATMRTVFNERATNRDIATEDAVALVVETASGAIGTLLVSQVAPGRKNSLTFELSGSSESIRFDQENPETLWLGRRSGTQLLAREPGQLSPDAARLALVPAGHPLGYQDAFNAFVADTYAAIAGGTPEGLPTFDDGLRAVQVTEAVLESAATGTWAELRSPQYAATGGAA
jgi:predicted dehydrogenase